MLLKILMSKKALCFIGGVASATIGKRLLSSKATRELCVKGVAYGMRLQKDAREAFQNIKEEAADICHDAQNLDAEQPQE